MDEILRKACKENNTQYVSYIIDAYIDGIYYISNRNNTLNNLMYLKYCMDINSIIVEINTHIDNIIIKLKKSALVNAITKGDSEIVKCLIKNINKYSELNTLNNNMILYNSCGKGHLEIVKNILTYCWNIKSNINIYSDNEYILHVVCYNGHIDIMKYLIEYSEKLNKKFNLNYRDYYRMAIQIKSDISKYILYLRKHNYDKWIYDLISHSELFNCKFIDIICTGYICNNILVYIIGDRLIESKYVDYCLFVGTNK